MHKFTFGEISNIIDMHLGNRLRKLNTDVQKLQEDRHELNKLLKENRTYEEHLITITHQKQNSLTTKNINTEIEELEAKRKLLNRKIVTNGVWDLSAICYAPTSACQSFNSN
jgi:uncharacterized protein YydD (DUF2326 family)